MSSRLSKAQRRAIAKRMSGRTTITPKPPVNGSGRYLNDTRADYIPDRIEDFEPEVVCLDDKCNSFGIPVPVDQCADSMTCVDCGSDLYEYDEDDYDNADVPQDLFDTVVNGEVALSRAHSHRDMDQGDRQRLTQMVIAANPASVPHVSDTFTCPPDLTGCPIAHRCTVYIPLSMVNECVFLCTKFDTEWIAYLTGHARPDEQDSYEITGMYFPRQHANGAHVDAEDGEIRPGTIAAIHSHVNFNVFFSDEDKKHMNHTIELVVNRKGEIAANGRVTLGCGRSHRGDAIVKFTGTDHEEELRKQLSEVLIQEQWRTPQSAQSGQSGHNYSWVPKTASQQPVTHIASAQASGDASSTIWGAGSGDSKGSDFNVNGSGKGHGGAVGN